MTAKELTQVRKENYASKKLEYASKPNFTFSHIFFSQLTTKNVRLWYLLLALSQLLSKLHPLKKKIQQVQDALINVLLKGKK